MLAALNSSHQSTPKPVSTHSPLIPPKSFMRRGVVCVYLGREISRFDRKDWTPIDPVNHQRTRLLAPGKVQAWWPHPNWSFFPRIFFCANPQAFSMVPPLYRHLLPAVGYQDRVLEHLEKTLAKPLLRAPAPGAAKAAAPTGLDVVFLGGSSHWLPAASATTRASPTDSGS